MINTSLKQTNKQKQIKKTNQNQKNSNSVSVHCKKPENEQLWLNLEEKYKNIALREEINEKKDQIIIFR